MAKVLSVFAIAAGVLFATPLATDPVFRTGLAANLGRGLVDGMILGSNAWPSVPADVRSRQLLQLVASCNERGQCELVPTTDLDD